MLQIVLSGGTHAALRTARRRGKPRLRVLVAAGAGPWPAPDSALRSRFPVCRVRRAARMVRWRSMCPVAVPMRRNIRRRALLRGATVSAVTNEETKTGSERDCRAARGAARVAEALWRVRFSTASNPGAPNAPARWGGNRSAGSECALRRWASVAMIGC